MVCGVTLEVCVHTTVREANDRGYECVVLSDCVASYFPEFQRVGLEMIKAQGPSSVGSPTPTASSPPPHNRPMSTGSRFYPNLYKDSVSLMTVSAQVTAIPGIEAASVVMASATNVDNLAQAGLGTFEVRPNDLVVAVSGTEGGLRGGDRARRQTAVGSTRRRR